MYDIETKWIFCTNNARTFAFVLYGNTVYSVSVKIASRNDADANYEGVTVRPATSTRSTIFCVQFYCCDAMRKAVDQRISGSHPQSILMGALFE